MDKLKPTKAMEGFTTRWAPGGASTDGFLREFDAVCFEIWQRATRERAQMLVERHLQVTADLEAENLAMRATLLWALDHEGHTPDLERVKAAIKPRRANAQVQTETAKSGA